MRILLDHNTPVPLRRSLHGHEVETAYERGWSELLNGDLITAAESAGFDLLITTDKGIRYQQNWAGRRMAMLILSTNDWTRIRLVTEQVLTAVNSVCAADYVNIEIPLAG